MPPKDDDLADRFRRALEDQEVEIQSKPIRPSVDVAEARDALFQRLQAFAQQVQQIEAREAENSLLLSFGGRGVRFYPSEEGVIVTYEGWPVAETHRAWPERALDGRWVLEFHRLGRVEQLPMFERGLEELLVHGLGLPRPAPSDRPIAARTAAALTGRTPELRPPAAPSAPQAKDAAEAPPKRGKRDL